MIKKNAQSIMEYVILLVIVALAVGGMKMYMLRSVKAQFKVMQDQLSDKDKDQNPTPGSNITITN